MALDHLECMHTSFAGRDIRGHVLAKLAEEIARTCVKVGRTEDAQRYFLLAIEEDDGAVRARLGVAELFLSAEEWDAALGMLEFLVDGIDTVEDPSDKAQIYALRGQVFAQIHEPKQAKQSFETALSHDPHNTVARGAMA